MMEWKYQDQSRSRFAVWIAMIFVVFAAVPDGLAAAHSEEVKKVRRTIAGEQYKVSGFHKWLLGKDYRDLWVTPIEVEVLDLNSFANGLRPVRRVGGMQTLGLAMEGADGRSYTFRGVDKDPTSFLPPSFRDTLAAHLIQDQIAAAIPGGTVIVPVIADAVGVLHTKPRLVMMPDDAVLGEFQEAFGGALGTIEEYPLAASETNPGFFGATEIVSTKEMWKRLFAGPEDHIDSRAFLRARLLDILIGDWDRHGNQWRWAKIPGKTHWQPISEDRDQAFVSYEGLVLQFVRSRKPQLVRFKEKYPGLEGLTWSCSEVDRWILTDLNKSVWIEMATEIQNHVTDEIIEAAVQRMPKEYYELSGVGIESKLKQRRNKLLDVAQQFYYHLAGQVDIRCTNKNEIAKIRRFDSGDIEVNVALAVEGEAVAEPYFRRRFSHKETTEIRIYLYGGDDLAISLGGARHGIKVRVVGGAGSDTVDDSERGGIQFFDSKGDNQIVAGPGTKYDSRMYNQPVLDQRAPWAQPRDWGRWTRAIFLPGMNTDIGILLGGGIKTCSYGFRKYPYASSHWIRGDYSIGVQSFRFEYEGDFRRMNSSLYGTVFARASGIEILRFYGFGNETSKQEPDDFNKVKQSQFSIFPALNWAVSSQLILSIGPDIKFARSKLDPETLLGQDKSYGVESFGQLGLRLGFRYNTCDPNKAGSPGVRIQAEGFLYPEVWDAESAFGGFSGSAAAYLPATDRIILAVRIGGKKVFGSYPFHEAAYIGGKSSVRGFRRERFAGDASIYGNVELRVTLGKALFILPGEYGVFGLTDVGRVYFKGESSKKWHSAVGGGIFFSIFDYSTVFSLAIARCEEKTSVYLKGGFSF
ncbi:MAG: BamA/TamA family outer membrane protein [Candidatus Aminicenantes bacterium]|nr:BamA/TamA family outer membrane protein [Candidatus Aminicenantes bacterium]